MTEPAPAPLPAQRPPSGLGKAGRALWRSITGAYQLDPRETTTLAAAARQADDLAALETALAAGALVVEGSKGQPVLNAAVGELRQGRLALARLLGTLNLPTEDGGPALTSAQLRAQKAANTRWDLQRLRLARRTAADGSAS